MIRTLQTRQELEECRQFLHRRKLDFAALRPSWCWRMLYRLRYRTLMPDVDVIKSWDVANAARIIEDNVPGRGLPILDMGCYNSEILYVLYALNYQSLHGCDLSPLCRWMPYWHRIRYRQADLTATPYPDRYFAAITCLSVIEHGVPPEKLVAEVKRLLRPGGVFILTTDYDGTGQPHHVPDAFRVFGQSWKVFDRAAFHQLLEQFAQAGFSLLRQTEAEDTHTERPISWNGQDFTFSLAALTIRP